MSMGANHPKVINIITSYLKGHSETYKVRMPRAGHECLVWRFSTVVTWGNKRLTDDNGTQADNLAGTFTKQQQLLAKRHVRSRLDRSRSWRTNTSYSDIATKSWYSVRQSSGYMRYQ